MLSFSRIVLILNEIIHVNLLSRQTTYISIFNNWCDILSIIDTYYSLVFAL